ncbi:SDR family oxidoreductase [Nocardioides panzhihuensis]|uniref:Short-subunit dehydrogenase n=1 Tax=Nocardioides panzhihuensis TaxID=860243 RepID=A0A7Z0DMA8_9ACTN|nr:SDR family oxidoreductase [Nocardioides panzhihuensis]NYI78000.1 short-subunit dehydrogenase [Nocardioides panzhihuensis]
MTRQIKGTAVIVTGGARGIGRATVERLARAGAKVAVGDLDPDLLDEVVAEFGPRVMAAHLDVTDPSSWRVFLDSVADLGPWDVLVNNAGIMPLGSVLKEDDALTRAIFEVNVHGPINGIKAVAPAMVDRGKGHIVNVASAVGRVPVPDAATYSASKFAVVGFSEALRMELAPSGIDVSLILPAVVQTELADGVPAAKGMKPVTAEDVAATIEAVIREPRPEVWVPNWAQALTKITQAMPRKVQDFVDRATNASQLLAGVDPAERAAYEERVRRNVR